MSSLVLTYLPLIRAIRTGQTQFLGLDWKWWVLIGVTILVLVMISVVVRLILMYQKAISEDAKLDRKKKQLDIDKLEREKPYPGPGGL